MTAFPLPVESAPGAHVHEGAGRLINTFALKLGDGAGTPVSRKRVPGLTSRGTSSNTGYRGGRQVGSLFYSAWESGSGKVYKSTSSWAAMAALTGNLPGTARAFWSANNAATPDVVAVVPGEGAFSVSTTAVSAFADADVGSPNACCFHKGFHIFTYGDAKVRSTGVNNVAVNTLDVATAEYKRDTLYRPMSYKGQLILWGSGSREHWGGQNDTGFPFSFIAADDVGIVGPYAATGDEDGFNGGVHFVGDDFRVRRLEGYGSVPVSKPDLERLIAAVADKTTINADCYVHEGMPTIVISCASWTWELNLTTGLWNERVSYEDVRWRGLYPAKAFDKWICGDTEGGTLAEIDPTNHEELGNPLRMEIWTGPIGDFPNGLRVDRVDLYATKGIGIASGEDPNQTDPTIECEISPDGGHNWKIPRQAKLGRQAVMTGRVAFNNMGHCIPQGVRLRFRFADAVPIGIMGGDMKASPLR